MAQPGHTAVLWAITLPKVYSPRPPALLPPAPTEPDADAGKAASAKQAANAAPQTKVMDRGMEPPVHLVFANTGRTLAQAVGGCHRRRRLGVRHICSRRERTWATPRRNGTGVQAFLKRWTWGLQLVESERPRTLDNWAARMAGSGSRTVRAEPSSSRHGGVLNEAIEAERGDATAQFNLAVQYRKGNGVAMDASRAALWYLKAADQGHAKSQNNLGVLYRNGVGKDACEAARWFRKAAEQGLAAAQWKPWLAIRERRRCSQRRRSGCGVVSKGRGARACISPSAPKVPARAPAVRSAGQERSQR